MKKPIITILIFLSIIILAITNYSKPFINIPQVIQDFKDSLNIDLASRVRLFEAKFSDDFAVNTILYDLKTHNNETHLIELFNDANLRLNYADTSSARTDEIIGFALSSLFNEDYLISFPSKNTQINAFKKIKTEYYPDIYNGRIIQFSTTIALIDDLYEQGVLTGEELNFLLVVRFVLLDISRT